MKKIILPLFAGSLIMTACIKNNLNNQSNTWSYKDPATASLKIINAYTALTPSSAVPAAGPSVDIYVNGIKINATPVAYSGIYPNVAGAYAQAPSGMVNIKAIVNRAGGNIAGDTLANGNYQVGPTTHSLILVDTLPFGTPSSPNLLVVGESVSPPAYGKFKVRFMNMVASPADTLDVYSRRLGGNVATGILFKNLSDWLEMPVTTTTDTLELRKKGTTTSITNLNSFSGATSRSYTLLARGNTVVTGRTRTLTFFTTQ